MRDAFGALQWTPEVFWRSTMTEYFRAIEGFNAANGGEEQKNDGPTDEEMSALLAKYG